MAEDGIHPGDLIVVIKPAGDSKAMFGELVFERSLALREGDVLRAD